MKLLPICAIFLPLLSAAMAGPLLQASFFSNCGLGSGEDVCSNSKNKKCSPLVVRPMEIPIPTLPTPKMVSMPVGGVAPLVPIAGPCSCAASLVRPATVPRPACSCAQVNIATNQQMNMNMNHQQQQQIVFGSGMSGYGSASSRPVLVDQIVNPENPANYVPADPISLGLAYQMSQENCHHNEDRLAFGFRQIPKDIPLYARKRVNNIPEGDLYNLNGQIVELKKVACVQKKSLDEEAIEELINAATEEEEREQAEEFKKVSLGEIGYGPAKIKAGAFVNVQGGGGSGIDIDDTVAAAGSCNDGYQPGNVVITQIPQPSPVAMPIPLPEPCASEEGVDIPAVPSFPNGYSSPYTFVSQQSASSSSCANKLSQSVVLQKLGCNK